MPGRKGTGAQRATQAGHLVLVGEGVLRVHVELQHLDLVLQHLVQRQDAVLLVLLQHGDGLPSPPHPNGARIVSGYRLSETRRGFIINELIIG